jgi:SAM-dependent methyltransferase
LSPELQNGGFDKCFSNAAMHWILRSEESREQFFRGVRNALKPGGAFVFEMGGMGNVAEVWTPFEFNCDFLRDLRTLIEIHQVKTALLSVIGRRVGIEKAREANPWFFPDEIWMTKMMEETVGGFKIEKIEREYRPTKADAGGVEGWLRLMGKQFLSAVEDEKEREECVKEVCEVLNTVCASPGGGDWFGYVRLRVLAHKI